MKSNQAISTAMKTIFFVLFLLMTGVSAHAQRQLAGQKGLEVVVGIVPGERPVKNYYYTRLGMTINRKRGNYYYFTAEFRRSTYEFDNLAIPIETYTGEAGYSIYLLGDWRRTFTVNLGLSATAGYEVINKGEKQLSNGAIILSDDHFVYGGGAQLSLETYLNDKLVVLLHGYSKYLFGTSAEHLRPGAGMGIRYTF
jgi:hypothetical protein